MSSGEASDGSFLKRQRVSRACDQCRRKKIKCDGLFPVCTNCQAFTLQCSYNDTTKKRGPPKGYIEAIENRLYKLEQTLADIADHSDDARSKAVLAELHAPLETAYGEQIRTRPIRRGRSKEKNRTFFWQTPSSSSPASPTVSTTGNITSTQLMDSPIEDEQSSAPGSPVGTSSSAVNDSHGQLSMDESGQVRFLGKSSGFYLLQNSRSYHDGAFHLSHYGHHHHKSSSSTSSTSGLVNSPTTSTHLDPLAMPPKDLSFDLISLYFTHFYPVLPMFYKKRLTLPQDGPAEAVSPLLVNAIYAVASRISPDTRVRADPSSPDTAGDVFFERAKRLLDDYYDVPRISTVQALLLMAMHQHGTLKGPRAWLYSGMAFRMAQDMGLHRNCDHWDISLEDRERRKRVFWCCFIVDRLLSATFGRASLFEERDCDVPFPSVDDDEPISPPNDNQQSNSPVRLLDAFVHTIRICDILGHVLKSNYYAKAKHHTPGSQHIDHVFAALNQQLTNWYHNLPPALGYDLNKKNDHDQPNPVCQLHMIYYTTVILLHRSFIPPYSKLPPASLPSYNVCMSAAESISEIVDGMLQNRHLKCVTNFGVYYIFTAGIMFIKAAAASDADKAMRAKAKIRQIMCALDEVELTWTTAGRCCDILGDLAGLRQINLETDDKHSEATAGSTTLQTPSPMSLSATTMQPPGLLQQGFWNTVTAATANSNPLQQQQQQRGSVPTPYPNVSWMNPAAYRPPVPTVDPFAAPDTIPPPSQQQQQFDPLGTAFWGVPQSLDINEWNNYFGGQQQQQQEQDQQQPQTATGASSHQSTLGAYAQQQEAGNQQPLIPSHEYFQPRLSFSNHDPSPLQPLQQQQQQQQQQQSKHLIHNDDNVDVLSGIAIPETKSGVSLLGFLGGQTDPSANTLPGTEEGGNGSSTPALQW